MPANPNWARWVFASVATYLPEKSRRERVAPDD